MLGIPFIPTVGARGKGINKLFHKVAEVYTGTDPFQRNVRINYGYEVEHSISTIEGKMRSRPHGGSFDGVTARFIALGLLNRDRYGKTSSVRPGGIMRSSERLVRGLGLKPNEREHGIGNGTRVMDLLPVL
jgi:ferrous iron transport protein B